MLYASGLEFVTAFFGCLYAGIIAVPAYPPRKNQKINRLKSIIEDSKPEVILTTQNISNHAKLIFDEDKILFVPDVAIQQEVLELFTLLQLPVPRKLSLFSIRVIYEKVLYDTFFKIIQSKQTKSEKLEYRLKAI